RAVPQLRAVGRDSDRLAASARAHDIPEWTPDLGGALADPAFDIVFDGAATHQRAAIVEKAIAAGKHIYCEKPVATSVAEARALLRAAEKSGRAAAAVEDKIYLPGLQKLLGLAKSGFFGRVVNFRLDFGWWVFDGSDVPCQRPSWNYRQDGGGGLILDMVPHWRYIIEDILGP